MGLMRRPPGPLFEPTARKTDPGTSHHAAATVKPTELRRKVLTALTKGPAIAEVLCERTGIAWNTLTPRLREIERRGWIARDGKAVASTGRRQTRWQLTQEGWNTLGEGR
jgi:predicted ArsR family transcriptional regulator